VSAASAATLTSPPQHRALVEPLARLEAAAVPAYPKRMRLALTTVCLSALALAGSAEAAPASKPRQIAKADIPKVETAAGGVQALDNATQAQVRARFGEPDVARAEGAGAFWTYRLPDCALFVFFRKEGKALRVSGLSSGPRRRGESAPEAAICMASVASAE
jgi:hypothetical protein